MLDREMIDKRITKIQQELRYLEKFQELTFDDVAKDYKAHHIVERIIEVVVGCAIDINQHIIVEQGRGNLPFDFKESFLLLEDLGVYPKEFAQKISNSAGLRNILVHEYTKLDEKMFYNSIKDCYRDYTKYCRYIIDHLKKTS